MGGKCSRISRRRLSVSGDWDMARGSGMEEQKVKGGEEAQGEHGLCSTRSYHLIKNLLVFTSQSWSLGCIHS